jgi:2-keto-4-pentenoate hydratase/2-oxohepta-3-ene-1,7-dioic acid hydratase in catechol pathway
LTGTAGSRQGRQAFVTTDLLHNAGRSVRGQSRFGPTIGLGPLTTGRNDESGSRSAAKRYKLRSRGRKLSPSRVACAAQRGSTAEREHHMKLLYFDDFKLGVLKGDAVVDVSAIVSDIPHSGPGELMNGLIERFAAYRPKLEAAVAKGQGVPLASVRIRPPLPKPATIDCMAVNYMEDGTRSAPAPINAFHKSPSAIIGNGDTMVLPDVPAPIFEGEAEMAVVIGKTATNVSQKDAMGYIFGYTNFIDGSARGLPPPGNVFFQMKSRDTFAPIGPFLVTADEIKDPQKLQIRLWNNGTLMQNFNTDDMGHKIPRCIEWLSSIHTLQPGDIIATGTNHRGLNPFMDGDKVELETEGLGRLTFHVKDELKRTWARKTRLQMHEESNTKTPGNYPDFTTQMTGKYAK